MERIIKDQLLSYFISNSYVSPNQHAFIAHHSTATNLLECTNDWAIAFNSPNPIDIIYVDFSKAFDSIVFDKLLYKLNHYGICGNLLKWIEHFLKGRSQCVSVDGYFSAVSDVISGVPQGSVLGPVLFLIFINDIVNICASGVTIKIFADDVKLYSVITGDLASLSIQNSLDNLIKWSSDWQLYINISKCNLLTISSANSHLHSLIQLHDYFIDNLRLTSVDSLVDLGITMCNDLSFNSHINTIVSKSLQRSGVFFRGFTSRNLLLMRKSFITYIRPILEYDSIIWNPNSVYLIDLIENVQKKFTKRIHSICNLSYLERLEKLHLEPLELRRLRFDLVNYFKILSLPQYSYLKNRFNIYHPPSSSRTCLPRL